MCYIELKNEKYETLEDLKRLLHYILRLDKTAEDSQRANTITNTLAGCQPAMIPNEYLCDPSSVYHLMLFEVRRRHKGIPQFAKHRIVSFAATDCILPQDVVSLAERIASIYAKKGYITAYGIHADSISPSTNFCMASRVLSSSISFGNSIGRSARTLIFCSSIVCLQIKTGQSKWIVL